MGLISKEGKVCLGMSAAGGAVDGGIAAGIGTLMTGAFPWAVFLGVGAVASGLLFVTFALAKASGDAAEAEREMEREYIKSKMAEEVSVIPEPIA